MKIYLGATTLAAGDREAASGFRIDHVRPSQLVEYVRAPYSAAIPRQNWRHVITFSVARVHSSLTNAADYVLDHAASLPTSGTLHIETNSGAGDRWIEDAVLTDVQLVEFAGCHTRHSYTLVGGEVLTTDPAGP